jgi:hypothetical protein
MLRPFGRCDFGRDLIGLRLVRRPRYFRGYGLSAFYEPRYGLF